MKRNFTANKTYSHKDTLKFTREKREEASIFKKMSFLKKDNLCKY